MNNGVGTVLGTTKNSSPRFGLHCCPIQQQAAGRRQVVAAAAAGRSSSSGVVLLVPIYVNLPQFFGGYRLMADDVVMSVTSTRTGRPTIDPKL